MIVNFKIQNKENHDMYIEGFIETAEIDDEKPLTFIGHDGLETKQVPENIWGDEYENSYNQLVFAFQNDILFLQFLYDLQNEENKVVDRVNYYLIINE